MIVDATSLLKSGLLQLLIADLLQLVEISGKYGLRRVKLYFFGKNVKNLKYFRN